jgi:hypothetical protein
MNQAEKIKKLYEQAELDTLAGKDKAVLEKMKEIYLQQSKAEPKTAEPYIWRTIMKSNITKLAAAAIIIITCIIGFTIFDKTSNFALADVLEHIKQVNAVFYQQKMNATIPIFGMEMKQNMSSKVWVSQDYGMRMDMEMVMTTNSNSSDPNGQVTSTQTYLLPKQNQIISIIPSQKQYIRADITEKQALAAKQQGNDPNLMVKQILDCNYIRLGRSTVDGIEVEGFQTTDPNFQGGVYSSGKVDVKLWVDVKTQLPVRIEMDVQLSGQTNMKMHSVTYGYQWDVPVDTLIFEPIIPDDYTSATSTPVQFTYDESAVIKGLKLYTEMFEKFPEKLDINGLLSPLYKLMQELPETAKSKNTDNLPPFFKIMKEETKGLSQEEQKQKTMDFTMNFTTSVTGLSTFYAQLVKENKDPAYYGDKVTPKDFDQVLMRWKVEDGVYRVIFADLSAGDFTSQELAELEAKLPQ